MPSEIIRPAAQRGFRAMVVISRVLIGLAAAALVAAWIAGSGGGSFLGFSQGHLFSDATVLALLGIACLIDSFAHRKGA